MMKRLRRGWNFGGKGWLMGAAVVSAREGHGRLEREETEQEKAEGIVRTELALAGWTEADLLARQRDSWAKYLSHCVFANSHLCRALSSDKKGWLRQHLPIASSNNATPYHQRVRIRRASDADL